MYLLEGLVRTHAWGSRTAIPELLGCDPDDTRLGIRAGQAFLVPAAGKPTTLTDPGTVMRATTRIGQPTTD